jgi:cytochrome P450
VQRDGRVIEDPDRFDPWRTTGTDGPAPVMLPVGDGARRCLGEALACEQISVIVRAVAQHLRLRPGWPGFERAVLRATILVPARGGLVATVVRGAR